MRRLDAPRSAATISLSFKWMARASLFCARWMRNTIRKVTIVVPVLITSCHVSEKWKSGPVQAHTRTTRNATPNAQEVPTQSVSAREKRSSPRPIAGRFGTPPRRISFGRRLLSGGMIFLSGGIAEKKCKHDAAADISANASWRSMHTDAHEHATHCTPRASLRLAGISVAPVFTRATRKSTDDDTRRRAVG